MLVIGGCGSLGHHIVKQSFEDPELSDIAGFDVSTQSNRVDGVKYIEGSLTSRNMFYKHFKKPNLALLFIQPHQS